MFKLSWLAPVISLALSPAAFATSASLSPEVPKGVRNFSYAFANSQKIIPPMRISSNLLSTATPGQGASVTMVFLPVGTFAIDLQVLTASNAPASLNYAIHPYGSAAGTFEKIDFIPSGKLTFQRLPSTVSVKAASWYLLELNGLSAGLGLQSVRLVESAAVVPVPPVVVTPPPPTPPVTTPPVSTPTPGGSLLSPSSSAVTLAAFQKIAFGGVDFVTQTPNVVYDSAQNALFFKASTGEFAVFDPADGRKIRNEVLAVPRFEKGQTLTAEFDLGIVAPDVPHKDLQWFNVTQIHQADTRDANGNNVMSSPMFALNLQPNAAGNGYELTVEGETSTLPNGGFVAARFFAHVPFKADGSLHHIKMEVRDSHGAPGGMIRVAVDGVQAVDQPNIPTGYAYVDTNVLYGGKAQDSRSYLKLGIYAGNQFKPAPVTLQTIVRGLKYSLGN